MQICLSVWLQDLDPLIKLLGHWLLTLMPSVCIDLAAVDNIICRVCICDLLSTFLCMQVMYITSALTFYILVKCMNVLMCNTFRTEGGLFKPIPAEWISSPHHHLSLNSLVLFSGNHQSASCFLDENDPLWISTQSDLATLRPGNPCSSNKVQ